ncbi:MAG TPA: FKBP-type peptidyl-prolyl cis-trans isomerase [Saprospiraceae bacterium]|nr:FKBP-type peptidyl-prolyl cis-trans isomerase [Saprospiraceae bacterium]
MRFLLLALFAITLFSCEKGRTPEQQLQYEIEKIQDYLNDRNLTAQSTASGLHYIITEEGSGTNPSANSTVTVHYVGKLMKNENVFDQTNGNPATFKLANLIEGWKEGIPLLKRGGKGTFFVPSALGYGPYGSGDIPGNATLIFEIELVDF